MEHFWAFIRRRGWPSLVLLFGVVVWAYGVVTTAYDLYTANLMPWALQLIGGLVVFAALAIMVYQMDAIAQARPSDAPPAKPKPLAPQRGGSPDCSLQNAIRMIRGSEWAAAHDDSSASAVQELLDKLSLGQLEVWGEPPGANRLQHGFPADVWAVWGLDPTANAAMQNGQTVLSRVQFDADQVRGIWPGRRDRA